MPFTQDTRVRVPVSEYFLNSSPCIGILFNFVVTFSLLHTSSIPCTRYRNTFYFLILLTLSLLQTSSSPCLRILFNLLPLSLLQTQVRVLFILSTLLLCHRRALMVLLLSMFHIFIQSLLVLSMMVVEWRCECAHQQAIYD